MTSLRPDANVLARRVGDELVLVHPRRNEVFSLNVTGARLWELMSEGRTRSELVDRLTVEFEVTRETAEQATDELLGRLEREGLLTVEED